MLGISLKLGKILLAVQFNQHRYTNIRLFVFSATAAIPLVVSSPEGVQIITTAMNTYLGPNSTFPNSGFYPPQYGAYGVSPDCK